jgi:hypothetical protein
LGSNPNDLNPGYLQIGLLQKINALPTISRIEDKSPIGDVLVYAAPIFLVLIGLHLSLNGNR